MYKIIYERRKKLISNKKYKYRDIRFLADRIKLFWKYWSYSLQAAGLVMNSIENSWQGFQAAKQYWRRLQIFTKMSCRETGITEHVDMSTGQECSPSRHPAPDLCACHALESKCWFTISTISKPATKRIHTGANFIRPEQFLARRRSNFSRERLISSGSLLSEEKSSPR